MALANVLVTITHVDDSPRCRQGPCIHFWGTTDDRNNLVQLEEYILKIKHISDSSPPPLHHGQLADQVCCAFVRNRWVRGKLTNGKMDDQGKLEVLCIDTGTKHHVSLEFLRSLQIPGPEAIRLREWPGLASKFILADVVAPRGQWTESAIVYLKTRLENHTWKASSLGTYNGYTGLRLYEETNQLLATTMIRQRLAVAAASYQEALTLCPQYDEEPNWAKPAGSPSPPPSPTMLPTVLMQNRFGNLNNIHLPTGPCKVKVLNIPSGPFKFTVQPMWGQDQTMLLSKLEAFTRSGRLSPLPPSSPEGTPCLAFPLRDRNLYRGILTTSLGGPEDKVGVRFVDTDCHDFVSSKYIYNISDELLDDKFFTYRVSLVEGERLSKLNGVSDSFSLLAAGKTFHCQVLNPLIPDVIDLYDESGTPMRDMLIKLHENMTRKKTHLSSSSYSLSPASSPCLIEVAFLNFL